jgi:hypothetical protein
MSGNARSMFRRLRLMLGFLVTAALPGLFLAMPFLFSGHWRSALIMLALGLRIAVPPAIGVALPLYWWLSRTGRLSIYWAVMAGGAAGAALGLYAVVRRIWLFGSNKPVYEIWNEIFAYEEAHLFVLIGMVCGLIGWLVAFGPRAAPRDIRAPRNRVHLALGPCGERFMSRPYPSRRPILPAIRVLRRMMAASCMIRRSMRPSTRGRGLCGSRQLFRGDPCRAGLAVIALPSDVLAIGAELVAVRAAVGPGLPLLAQLLAHHPPAAGVG